MIPREDILLGNLTHVGRERTENQDYYGYYEPDDDEEFRRKGRLIVVCDGMGGHAGGEIASRLAVNSILKAYRDDQTGNVLEALKVAVEFGNRSVWDRSQQDVHLKGMGSTCTAMVLKNGIAYFGHVGDSRAYLVRNGAIKQVTKDHSLVQQMVDEGLLAEEEMEHHPEKNVILRSMGVKPTVDVDLTYQTLEAGDALLLCSDGLSGLVTKEDIRSITHEHRDEPMEACSKLVDLANQNGGYDNITVQIVKLQRVERETEQSSTTTQMFSSADVEASIAEARAEAQVPPSPRSGGMSPQSPVAEGGSGVPKLAIGAGAGLLLGLLLTLIVASRFGSTASQARAMQDSKMKAIAGRAPASDEEAYQAAQKLEDAAWGRLDSLFGPLFAGSAFQEAGAAYAGLKTEAPMGGGDEAAARSARERMTSQKDSARKAGAEVHAAREWKTATLHEEKGTKALEQKDFATASEQFELAFAAYRTAWSEAGSRAGMAEAERLKTEMQKLLREAETANVGAHWQSLWEAAERYGDEGLAALGEGNAELAVMKLSVGVEILREAIPKVVEFEKKKLRKVFKAATESRESARTAGAASKDETRMLYEEGDAEYLEARAMEESGKVLEGIRAYEAAADRFTQVLALLGSEAQRKAAEDVILKAESARKRADDLQASVNAPNEYHKGANALTLARGALESGEFKRATAQAQEAEGFFEEAASQAKSQLAQRLERVRSETLGARKSAETVDAPSLAASAFEKGISFVKEAERKAADGDVEKAIRHYMEAKKWFDTAAEEASARVDDPELLQYKAILDEVADAKKRALKSNYRYQWGERSEEEAERARTKGDYKNAILHLKDAIKHYKAASRTG